MNSNMPVRKTLMSLHSLRQELTYRAKVRRLLRRGHNGKPFPAPPADIAREHRRLWRRLTPHCSSSWLRLYGSISGNWDHRFVPEPVYYCHVEPRLNNKAFSKAHTDKNYMPLFAGNHNTPRTIASNIEGVFTDAGRKVISPHRLFEMLAGYDRFIIKPAIDSGGGKGVSLWQRDGSSFRNDGGSILTPQLLASLYGRNYIIQEVLRQHPFFSYYNPSSVNTLRIMTYRSVAGEAVAVLHAVMRVGRSGSLTDNHAAGGYACGIDNHGALTGTAVTKTGLTLSSVNGRPLVAGTRVQGYDTMKAAALEIASAYRYARLLGLDICLDEKGCVVLMEVNCLNNEINFFQMLGSPLFRDFTGEIVDWCTTATRSFLIDFDI